MSGESVTPSCGLGAIDTSLKPFTIGVSALHKEIICCYYCSRRDTEISAVAGSFADPHLFFAVRMIQEKISMRIRVWINELCQQRRAKYQ
jgi:hypothetical protein